MSEQARIASLQERIMKARNRARNMARGEYIFLIVTFIGFLAYFALTPSGGIGALALGTCGIGGMILFTIAEASANKTKNQLIKELEILSMKMGETAQNS